MVKGMNPYREIIAAGLFLWLVMMLTGCGGVGQKWYKPGHYQADYDVDCAECDKIAQSQAREGGVAGYTPYIGLYPKAFEQCLFARGWSPLPPDEAGSTGLTDTVVPSLCTVTSGVITGFDCSIRLPEGFRVLRQEALPAGPVQSSSVFCQGPGPVFINIIFQQSHVVRFDPIRYPVAEPFFLFDKSPKTSQWLWDSYCGATPLGWVGGIGAYLRRSPEQRIILIITSSLPPAGEDAPKGLRLDRQQYQAMHAFAAKYVAWMENAVTQSRKRNALFGEWIQF